MRLLLIFFTAMVCCSCNSPGKIFLTDRKGSAKTYEIGVKGECCGCVVMYCSQFADKALKKQLVAETTACQSGLPTLFIFEADGEKNVRLVKGYVAVSDSSAQFKFDDGQRTLFTKMDSIALARGLRVEGKFRFANLTGYREKKKGEKFHLYWLNEKGKPMIVSE
jgi:hypothetical protein